MLKYLKYMKFQPKLVKMAKYGGTPPYFHTKNKCVLNDSIWPKMHFGSFFLKFFFCKKLPL